MFWEFLIGIKVKGGFLFILRGLSKEIFLKSLYFED
jgi:hypothetical protein